MAGRSHETVTALVCHTFTTSMGPNSYHMLGLRPLLVQLPDSPERFEENEVFVKNRNCNSYLNEL
jgi:hypothetical protein